uniref:Uncharacterized protein n=1 Tax=Tetranychus urticae TaxID=32264 RepID=T1KE56_TETUR
MENARSKYFWMIYVTFAESMA